MHEHKQRYSSPEQEPPPLVPPPGLPSTSEDLHAWSIYRQNLNSDFTDSALGSSEKSPMPYGNFHLRESTVQSILNNPKYGPKSELGTNRFTYLKFGLPRVLPPRAGSSGIVSVHGGHKDNSSGYDSTDEELVTRARSVPPPTGIRAARSEDFLNGGGGGGARRDISSALAGFHGSQGNIATSRHYPQQYIDESDFTHNQNHRSQLRAVSEANLLRGAAHHHHVSHHYREKRDRRKSRSRYHSEDEEAVDEEPHMANGAFVNRGMEAMTDHQTRASRLGGGGKAASQLSVASRAYLQNGGVSYRSEAPMLNDKYFPRDVYGGSNAYLGQTHVSVVPNGGLVTNSNGDYDGFKYPHIQLRNLSYDEKRKGNKYDRVLDSISMEARGGELVAIMATKREEGTALCNILSNNLNRWRSQVRGTIVVNGVTVDSSKLQDRVSYVKTDNNFAPDMSVRQTMLFHAFLREPGSHSRARDTKGRINALIEDLGLAQVKHARVEDLTISEKQRLNVACHLLLDADIVVLDQPTRGMDIFDTFFLVEYLRQWAARGRIVMLTLHPPTYEILTMISKIVLISTGRLMYYGKRREMLPYFAFIEYPCPAYKNPADYYLDLVTLDDLSAEAMVESSQRIDQMASAYKRRAEPLSDPGPPAILPPKIKRANFLVQMFGIWIQSLIYMYPFNVINWVKLVLVSGVMSVCMGGIFLGIRWRYWDRQWISDPLFEQDNIGDRYGFHHVVMVVGIWPMIMAMISESWREKRSITRDVEDGLYSKFAYIVTKTIYSIPSAGGIFLAYIIPGYLLAGLHYPNVQDLNIFYMYIGSMLLYLLAVRTLALSMTHLFSSRHLAAVFTGLAMTSLSLVSGYVVHHEDVGVWASWLKYASPQWWMGHPIHQDELLPVSVFRCTGNPVITENSIIKQVPCGLPSGEEAVRYYDFLPKYESLNWLSAAAIPILVTALFYVLFQVLDIIFFLGRRQVSKQSRHKKDC